MICYENYPTYLVVANILEVLVALIAAVAIIAQLGLWAVLGYAILALLAVVLASAYGCTRCYYYGRVCGTGLEKIAALIFKKRDEEEFDKFLSHRVSWTLVAVVLVLPIAAGLISLREGFALPHLLWLAVFLGLMMVIMVTHFRFVFNHCQEAGQKRCALERLGKPL